MGMAVQPHLCFVRDDGEQVLDMLHVHFTRGEATAHKGQAPVACVVALANNVRQLFPRSCVQAQVPNIHLTNLCVCVRACVCVCVLCACVGVCLCVCCVCLSLPECVSGCVKGWKGIKCEEITLYTHKHIACD